MGDDRNRTPEERVRNCSKRHNAPPCYADAGTGRFHFCKYGDRGDEQRMKGCLKRLREAEGSQS